MAHYRQKRQAFMLSINVASHRPAPDRCVTPAEGRSLPLPERWSVDSPGPGSPPPLLLVTLPEVLWA